MQQPSISIIVPIYNAEKYLHRCINSILKQTYANYELLLIDDGSTDSSSSICSEFALRDERIIFFHKSNGGVSTARNIGLKNAIGDFIVFVDADDWVEELYLENLYKTYKNSKEEVDLVMGYATRHENNKEEKEHYPCCEVSNSDLSNLFLYNDLIWHTSPWGKLYKRLIITNNNLCFDKDMHIGEDAIFLFSYILKCRKIKIINSNDYHYVIDRTGSLTKRINSFALEYHGFKQIKKIATRMHAACNNRKELDSVFGWLIGLYQRRTLLALSKNKIPRKERINYLLSIDWSSYIQYVPENSYQGKVYKLLLKHHLYRLYDIIRYIFIHLSQILIFFNHDRIYSRSTNIRKCR